MSGVWQHATASGLTFLSLRTTFLATALAVSSDAEFERVSVSANASSRFALSNRPNTAEVLNADPDAFTANACAIDSAFVSGVSGSTAAHAAIAAESSAIATSQKLPVDFSVVANEANSAPHWGPLWITEPEPKKVREAWLRLKKQWFEDQADWSFWIEWYEDILLGTPLPWELTQRIALEVTEDEWDAGPQRVAARIAEIRRDFDTQPLDQDALHSHIQKLAQNPVLHADIAQSAGLQVEAAIQAFKREAPTNQLPDGFAAFETLAPTFLSISATLSAPVGTAPNTAALQAEINHLHSVIKQLRTDLQEARSRLSEARLTAPEAQQLRTFGEKAATFLTCVVTTGIIGSGIANFFGVSVEDQTYETLKNALQGLSAEMENAQPAPEAPTLPEATEV